jgi:hypothetical protein
MIVVAIAGSALYGWTLWWRASEYRKKAIACETREQMESAQEKVALVDLKLSESSLEDAEKEELDDLVRTLKDSLEFHRANAKRQAALPPHYRKLKHKYKYDLAARCPWLPVPPDPPPPN